uniref:Uncharacterized protein n=1 Tax=Panagrolaimus davidi TaxID=227884 RepID=A0A914QJ22_9BILA
MNNNAKNNLQHKCFIHPPPLSSVSTNNFLHQIPPTSVQPRANGVANLNNIHPVPFGRHFPYMHPNVIRDADATHEVRRPTTHKLVDPSVVPKRGKRFF